MDVFLCNISVCGEKGILFSADDFMINEQDLSSKDILLARAMKLAPKKEITSIKVVTLKTLGIDSKPISIEHTYVYSEKQIITEENRALKFFEDAD